jgi:hypothetical protein
VNPVIRTFRVRNRLATVFDAGQTRGTESAYNPAVSHHLEKESQ